jgi:predicted permease
MSGLRRLVLRLLHLFQAGRADGDLAREIDSHLGLLQEDLERRGLSREEARLAARRSFGGVERAKELHRDARSFRGLDHLAHDVKYASRSIRVGTSAGAVAMLAVAIGLTTAMYTLINAFLLRPVPFRDADRLVNLYMFTEHGGATSVSASVLRAWRESPAFEAAEGAGGITAVLDVNGQPVVRDTAFVTPGLFKMLGVAALLGRLPDADESSAARGDSVFISEDLWRTVLGADRNILKQTIHLDGATVSIAGVLPSGFHYPTWQTQVWRPVAADTFGEVARFGPQAIVRFSARMSRPEALKLATDAAHAADPRTSQLRATPFELVNLAENDYYKRALSLLAGGVLFVFLALCSNVSGLLLTRFNARRREFAVCSALGASRGRILQRALVESVMLAAAGTMCGIGLSWGLLSIARAVVPVKLLAQTFAPLTIDGRALAAAVALGVVSALIAGMVPAWLATRFTATTASTLIERGGTESRAGRSFMRFVLVSEVALAFVLLVGATLLVRSFLNLSHVDRGFDPTGRVAVQVAFGATGDPIGRAVLADRIAEEVKQLPGVQAVTWSEGGPLTGSNSLYFYDWLPDSRTTQPVKLMVAGAHVGPDFFDIYRMRLLRGRAFAPGEPDDSVIVDDRLAAALWPDTDPVGRTFRGGRMAWHVVGVIKAVRRAVIEDRDVQMYQPLRPGGGQIITLKCGAACPSEGVIRQHLPAAIPGVKIYQVLPMDERYAADLAQPRAAATLAFAFAAVSLLAAAGGLFSSTSHSLGRRRREFGIRLALGASSAAVRELVFRESAVVLILGVAVGSLGSWALASALSSIQFGISISDPTIWLTVFVVLSAATILACWRPVRAAGQIDPAALLKTD